MTFYRHYTNKEDIALEIVTDTTNQRLQDHQEIFALDLPFEKKINLSTENTLKHAQNISNEFLNDIYLNYPILIKQVLKGRKELSSLIAANFEEYQRESQLNKIYSPEVIIQVVDMIYGKLRDPSFVQLFSSTQEAVVEINKIMFFGLMGSSKN